MRSHDNMQGTQRPRVDGIPQPGESIAGKYQVERVLGQGGMGVVVAAWHATLRKRVAVKCLLPSTAALPEAAGRMLREAQSASAIKSEHVARVLDVGTLETGSPYIIMEYLTGIDISELIRTQGPLRVEDAVDYVLQACEAIAEAHSLGIVHRDLKPSNLFLTSRADGSLLVKVLDFGLSKMNESSGPVGAEASLTATSDVLGSPHYMSPEQIRSLKHVDARTDIWSLGVILYQLLTGKRPFDGASVSAIIASIITEQPPPLRSHRGDIPTALEKVVFHCLEKELNRRAQSVSEVARALRPFGPESADMSVQRIVKILDGGSLESSQIAHKYSDSISSALTTATSTLRQPKSHAPRRVAVAAVVVIVTAIIAMGYILVSRRQPVASTQDGVVLPVVAASTGVDASLAPARASTTSPVLTGVSDQSPRAAEPIGSASEAVTPSLTPTTMLTSTVKDATRPPTTSPKSSWGRKPLVNPPADDKMDRWE